MTQNGLTVLSIDIYLLKFRTKLGLSSMENLATKEIKKIRGKLKKGPINRFVAQKPFADAMYRFSMFIISYY